MIAHWHAGTVDPQVGVFFFHSTFYNDGSLRKLIHAGIFCFENDFFFNILSMFAKH